MKRFVTILIAILALDFLAVSGLVGWLYQTGRLDKDKATAIREIVFPTTQPSTQPATTQPLTADLNPSTQPTLRLEELLAKQAGRPASEQVEFIQHAFDTQTAQLDRRMRELNDLQRQVDWGRQQLARDRAAYDAERSALEDQKQQTVKLESDKGFQDSLQLYTSMPTKQVKDIFMSLDDQTVMRYLQAMEPPTAARIIKEFKKPVELQRVQKVLEMMRQAQPSAAPTTLTSKG